MIVFLLFEHFFGERFDNQLLNFILLILVGVLYFLFIHPKLFKAHLNGRIAAFLAILTIGWGQAYNRQPLKTILFVLAYWKVTQIVKTGGLSDGLQVLLFFGFLALSVADAAFSSHGSNKRINRKYNKKLLHKRIISINAYSSQNHQFAVDTKMLMGNANLFMTLLKTGPVSLMISKQVFNDLDKLKKSKNKIVNRNVQIAFDVLEAYQKIGLLKLVSTVHYEIAEKMNLSKRADDLTTATYVHEFTHHSPHLLFLTQDDFSKKYAQKVGLPVVDMR